MIEPSAEAAAPAGHLAADLPPDPMPVHRVADPAGPWPRGHGRPARRGGGTSMIAVTSERLAISGNAAAGGYLPAVPADSDDRSFD
jgi:hypothetical protein